MFDIGVGVESKGKVLGEVDSDGLVGVGVNVEVGRKVVFVGLETFGSRIEKICIGLKLL